MGASDSNPLQTHRQEGTDEIVEPGNSEGRHETDRIDLVIMSTMYKTAHNPH